MGSHSDKLAVLHMSIISPQPSVLRAQVMPNRVLSLPPVTPPPRSPVEEGRGGGALGVAAFFPLYFVDTCRIVGWLRPTTKVILT